MIKKRRTKKQKKLIKPILRFSGVCLLSMAVLVMFFGYNTIFETYRGTVINNIKYHVDLTNLFQNVWAYANSF